MIARVHHATFRVADVEEAASRWGRLYGLTRCTDADDGSALLRCGYEDFCLELRAGPEPGIEHVAYELASGVTSPTPPSASPPRVEGPSASRFRSAARACGPRTPTATGSSSSSACFPPTGPRRCPD